MPRRKTLGDDHFKTVFNITVEDLGGNSKADDGRPVNDLFNDSSFYDYTTYNGIMERMDGKYKLHMTWTDLNNQGHRIVLPDQVVRAIHRCYETITKQSKSVGAKKAYQTRVEQGNEPPSIQDTLNNKGE
tara:strand:+ start:3745 stop:4134 length:390 start_codon:yes stop_codon:yes gene_type:complete